MRAPAGDIKHAKVGKFSRNFECNNRFTEPNHQNSGCPCQNSKNFFPYKTQPHCVGLVTRVAPTLSEQN